MKYIQKLNEQFIKKALLALFLFTYYSSQVFAQREVMDRVSTRQASSSARAIGKLENKTLQQLVADFIILASQYVLRILLGLIVLTFLYGLMKYMFKGQGSDTARSEGRKLMLWGIIGIFVVTSVWGLVAIFTNFVGHSRIVIPQFK